MHVLLLNDTTNNSHYGCAAVSNALRMTLVQEHDAEIYPVFNRQLRCDPSYDHFREGQTAWFREALAWCDAVVVNGEGTIHHGGAQEIEIALRLAYEAKKPFFVFNSLYEDYPRFVPLLKEAAGLSFRDEVSLAEVRAAGLDAARCCDAALLAAFDPFEEPAVRRGGAVTDWHGGAPQAAQRAIARCLVDEAFEFLMFQFPEAPRLWPQIVNRLARYERIVSGRYHGTLFSILAGTPVVSVSSNSHKMPALAAEFGAAAGLPGYIDDVGEAGGDGFVLEGRALAEARERLRAMAADPAMHPLAVFRDWAASRPVATSVDAARPAAQVFVNREPKDVEIARSAVDALSGAPFPLDRGRRLALMEAIGEKPFAARIAAELLIQEGRPEYNVYVRDALVGVGHDEAAHDVIVRSRAAKPSCVHLQMAFARQMNATGAPSVALAVFKAADALSPLSGIHAEWAAGSASRMRDAGAVDHFLAQKFPDADLPANHALRRAVGANDAGRVDDARRFAAIACADPSDFSAWQYMRAATILAANGDMIGGFEHMAEVMRRDNELYAVIMDRSGKAGAPPVIYFPEGIGVGSAMLGLSIMARRPKSFSGATLVIDPRLAGAAVGLLGPGVRCVGVEAVPAERFGVAQTVFDAMKMVVEAEPRLKIPGRDFLDEEAVAAQRDRLRLTFGDRYLCGLTWHTPNHLSGPFRSLKLAQLRAVAAAAPDIAFISLQPDNALSRFQLRQVNAPNIHVVDDVDPFDSIDDQLRLIGALDGVAGIDNTAMHFAGALGKTGTVLLSGNSTWQWPLRQSFFNRIGVVDTSSELCEAMRSVIR
ncbi:MAG: polysaccharide pyruvyl transferase family protein [Pseudomonadota bacterium]